jgi:hypothetical protein
MMPISRVAGISGLLVRDLFLGDFDGLGVLEVERAVDKEARFLFSTEVKGVGEGGKELSEWSESTAVELVCASKRLGGEPSEG